MGDLVGEHARVDTLTKAAHPDQGEQGESWGRVAEVVNGVLYLDETPRDGSGPAVGTSRG